MDWGATWPVEERERSEGVEVGASRAMNRLNSYLAGVRGEVS